MKLRPTPKVYEIDIYKKIKYESIKSSLFSGTNKDYYVQNDVFYIGSMTEMTKFVKGSLF